MQDRFGRRAPVEPICREPQGVEEGLVALQPRGGLSVDLWPWTEPNATDAGKAFGTQMKDATPRDGPHEDDGSRGSGTHAVFMCGTFLFIFPIGVVLLRSFERVKWHAGTQTGGLLVVCAGVGLGIWVSKFYNKVSGLVVNEQT